ncbi:uncharacterized mitochondrial protein AtMg00810-like [Cannabis sativa]|uniref:uncharacterized mitochondrial protein AtMg00810-like n=1 Tax=Cannabis sativa TaxID=3483 RepID=UPI0029C9EE43|nr:uncharacterized mitochondrial protein AtMg00810-like [Cannabis sativa]
MEANLKRGQDEKEKLVDQILNKRIVGKLQYLTITRPDISYSVNKLSQFLSTPRVTHLHATQRVLQYVKGSTGHGVFFDIQGDLQLVSVSLLEHLSSHGKLRNNTVSRSSAKTEYKAMANTTCEVIWLLFILKELKVEHSCQPSVSRKNQTHRYRLSFSEGKE